MDALSTPPEPSSFIPLADHQSRTPASFHSGPPILHYHSQQCKLLALERDLRSVPVLRAMRGADSDLNGAVGNQDSEAEAVVEGVDVWVTSEYVCPLRNLIMALHEL